MQDTEHSLIVYENQTKQSEKVSKLDEYPTSDYLGYTNIKDKLEDMDLLFNLSDPLSATHMGQHFKLEIWGYLEYLWLMIGFWVHIHICAKYE